MGEQSNRNRGMDVVMALAGLLAIVFILLNSQDVKIKFLVGETTAPLVFALIASTALGFLVGYMMGRFRDSERRRDRDND